MPEVTASCNPFRTRRLERLPFRTPRDGSPFDWESFLARFHSAAIRERGAVVGPHGSGKTTFLVEFTQRLESRGREVVRLLTNRDAGRGIPAPWLGTLRAAGESAVVVVDGYDVLRPFSRFWLRRALRPRGGLIVTAHRRCALPTLLKTRPSPRLLSTLVDRLFADAPGATRPTDESLRDLYLSHDGNLREVFRILYLAR